MASIDYPKTNGEYLDFASISMDVAGTRVPVGLDELNFEDGLEPGEVRGNASQVIGTTTGEYSASADFTCPLPQMRSITSLLAARGGVYSTRFNVTIHMRRGGETHTVELFGCRIKKLSDAHQQGTDALKRKAELHVMGIVRDNQPPYPEFRRP